MESPASEVVRLREVAGRYGLTVKEEEGLDDADVYYGLDDGDEGVYGITANAYGYTLWDDTISVYQGPRAALIAGVDWWLAHRSGRTSRDVSEPGGESV